MKQEILDIIAKSYSNGFFDNWDEFQFHLIGNCIKDGKEARLEMDEIIFLAMEMYKQQFENGN